jgi:hypothetical protein
MRRKILALAGDVVPVVADCSGPTHHTTTPTTSTLPSIVKRLVTATPTCIFTETISDTSSLFLRPSVPPASEYFELRPKQISKEAVARPRRLHR